MRHLHSGRKLGVNHSHRIALLRSLTLAIIEQDSIQTMPSRAKELRWYAERVVTLAKKGDLNSRRHIVKLLGSTETPHKGENRVRKVLDILYNDLTPRFKDRNGGYTQIIRIAKRRAGDNAEMCIMQYLPSEEKMKALAGKKDKAKAKKKDKEELKAKSSDSDKKSKEQPKKVKSDKLTSTRNQK